MNTPLPILPALPGVPGMPAEDLPGVPLPISDVAGDLFAELLAGAEDAAIVPWPDKLTARVAFNLAAGQGDVVVEPDETGAEVLTPQPTAMAEIIRHTASEIQIPDAPTGDPHQDLPPPARMVAESAGNAQPELYTALLTGAKPALAIEPVVHMAVAVDGEVLQRVRGRGLPVELGIPSVATKSQLLPLARTMVSPEPAEQDVILTTGVLSGRASKNRAETVTRVSHLLAKGLDAEMSQPAQPKLHGARTPSQASLSPAELVASLDHATQSGVISPGFRPAALQPLALNPFMAPPAKTETQPTKTKQPLSYPSSQASMTSLPVQEVALPFGSTPQAPQVEEAPQVRFVMEDWQAGEPVRSLRITLEPQELGQLKVSLHHRATGLHAKMVVDQTVALPVVRAQISALQTLLAARGIQFASFSLTAATAGSASGIMAPASLKPAGSAQAKASDRQGESTGDDSLTLEVSD